MKGKIICKGTAGTDTDFIRRFKDMITSTIHSDPKVRQTKKVLLVTAAWQTSEFNEQHIKKVFNDIGVASIYENGFDTNIQNLSIYHLFKRFQQECPDIYQVYHEKQETVKKIKEFYRVKNAELITTYWKQVELIRSFFPDLSLHDIHTFKQEEEHLPTAKTSPSELEKWYFCRQIQDTLQSIIVNDERMVKTIVEVERRFEDYTQLKENPVYRQIRQILKETILSANSIFIFSGHTAVLLNRLRFFGLRQTLIEALNRGTNFYTIGAGAEILCDKVILFNKPNREWPSDEPLPGGSFEFFDNGFGLIRTIQILPQDVSQFTVHKPDTLSYIASRFNSHTCVSLDKNSYLYIENQVHSQYDTHQQRYIAAGESDYLYIFTKEGRLDKKRAGEEIFPGEEIRGFTTLIARHTHPQLVDLLKRVHHLQKIDAQADIRRITERFADEQDVPLRKKRTTTFLYYDPTSTVKSVSLASSLGYGSEDFVFFQYKNSGIFYLPVEFQPVSRLEYKFILDYGNGSPKYITDPYNSRLTRSPFGVNSVMTTLDYHPTAVRQPNPQAKKGRLFEIVLDSEIMGDERRCKVHIPPGAKGPLPLVLFHDGYDYLEYSNLETILNNMFQQKLVRPFVSVLSHPVNRIEEYGCNPDYAKFLVEELLPTVRRKVHLHEDPTQVATAGASLGGLLSFYLYDLYPDVFGHVISQSGSFFMPRNGFEQIAKKHPEMARFVANFMRFPRKHNPKLVLTCGRFESLIYMNRIMVEALDRLNYDYRYFEYNDGHTWTGWADTMPTMLIHVFGEPQDVISERGVIIPSGLIGFHEPNAV